MDGITLGTAYVQVIPSTKGISGELSSALGSAADEAGASSGSKFGSSFGSALGGVAKTAAAGIAAVTGATTAVGAAFVKGAGDVASYGDEIDKMSQKLGISTTAYQEWDAILQHSGTSVSAMKPALKTLFAEAQKGSEAFTKLGISQEQAASMSKEDLFAATITALQGVEDENEKAALATELLGKGAIEMGALLNTSAEDTEAMRQRVHELGGVMSEDAVKAAAAYQDSLQDMTTAIDGVKRGIVSEFLPSITGVMNGLGNLFSGDSATGLGQIKEGISQFIQNMTEAIPQVISIGTSIVTSLGSALVDNLPTIFNAGTQALLQLASGISKSIPELVPKAVDAVLTLADGLLDNVDKIVEAGVELIVGLAEGLIKAIPKIIEKIPTIIAKLVEALTKSAPKIATAGVQLLSSLVKNLPQIISNIVKTIPTIISNIVKTIANGIPSMITAGANLMSGLGKGLINGIGNAVNAAKNAAGNVLNAVKSFFGIASPSKIMMEYGKFLDEGLAKGITGSSAGPVRSMLRLSDDLSDAFAPKLAADAITSDMAGQIGSGNAFSLASARQTDPGPSAYQPQESRDLTVILELDHTQLGRTVYRLNNEETQRVGIRLAGGYI